MGSPSGDQREETGANECGEEKRWGKMAPKADGRGRRGGEPGGIAKLSWGRSSF